MSDARRIVKLLVDRVAESSPDQMNFNLEYMKRVIDYYDACDSNGRKKHTWKAAQHQFKAIPHQQYISRFRHYIE